ncbi:MAG: hypothetical protein KatS3mg096_707 [Candidatus Parcubacteria bacterium]|nr:MAG: hypothetical protein KatS3mg096_680 [Candidatus Parcubacteria bacterium]GIW67839.1 MAG: hypothetical protein KatS3mg096_707 [Candidatus Parcubacteria bacterium]
MQLQQTTSLKKDKRGVSGGLVSSLIFGVVALFMVVLMSLEKDVSNPIFSVAILFMAVLIPLQKSLKKDKRGVSGGLVSSLIFGVVALVIGVIIAFVIVSTLTGSGLLTSGSAEDNATKALTGNLTSGVSTVASKLPIIFSVAAIVLILGVLVILVRIWQTGGFGFGGRGGGGSPL